MYQAVVVLVLRVSHKPFVLQWRPRNNKAGSVHLAIPVRFQASLVLGAQGCWERLQVMSDKAKARH